MVVGMEENPDCEGNHLKKKLEGLLQWAQETQRSGHDGHHENYYTGYVNAVEDILSMLEHHTSGERANERQ